MLEVKGRCRVQEIVREEFRLFLKSSTVLFSKLNRNKQKHPQRADKNTSDDSQDLKQQEGGADWTAAAVGSHDRIT